MSTLALEGSEGAPTEGRAWLGFRYADLVALGLALPIFIVGGFSMLGYGACAAAWLAQRAVQAGADRLARRALARGVRREALGALAGATLLRLWIVTLTILLVGVLGERSAGLAAALLALVLVTLSLGSRALIQLMGSEGTSR